MLLKGIKEFEELKIWSYKFLLCDDFTKRLSTFSRTYHSKKEPEEEKKTTLAWRRRISHYALFPKGAAHRVRRHSGWQPNYTCFSVFLEAVRGWGA